MKIYYIISALLLAGVLSFQSCKEASTALTAENVAQELQKKLITAKAGDKIMLPAGTFDFKRSISLNDTPDISIIGAGKGKTTLSFKNQIEGAEGLLIKNVKGLTLEGFTVVDSKGDAIKIQGCTNVVMRDLETTWSGGKLSTNGAYGLYPVSSTNVLMEECEASFAMDAGIYVGQSTNVVVRNNYVHDNVAGLEIENTINGEVYNNVAKNNTGGMMIFDMPDLPQANGDRIKFYDNLMENNNGENFAPKGMVVSTIPPGTGMFVMSHSNIDIHDNIIKGHNSVSIAVNSWLFTGIPFKSEKFDPYSTNVHIHDNEITTGEGPVDSSTDFGKLMTGVLGKPYDIIVDGIFKPGSEQANGKPTSYCFTDNGDVSFVNLNAGKSIDPAEMVKNLEYDISIFDCSLPIFDTKEHDAWIASN